MTEKMLEAEEVYRAIFKLRQIAEELQHPMQDPKVILEAQSRYGIGGMGDYAKYITQPIYFYNSIINNN